MGIFRWSEVELEVSDTLLQVTECINIEACVRKALQCCVTAIQSFEVVYWLIYSCFLPTASKTLLLLVAHPSKFQNWEETEGNLPSRSNKDNSAINLWQRELDLLVNRGTRAVTPASSETGQCNTTCVSEPSGNVGLAAKQENFGSLSLFFFVGK